MEAVKGLIYVEAVYKSRGIVGVARGISAPVLPQAPLYMSYIPCPTYMVGARGGQRGVPQTFVVRYSARGHVAKDPEMIFLLSRTSHFALSLRGCQTSLARVGRALGAGAVMCFAGHVRGEGKRCAAARREAK